MDTSHLFPDNRPMRPRAMSLGASAHHIPPAHHHNIDAHLQQPFRERRASEDPRAPSMMDGVSHVAGGKRARRKLVLCFDGTGNKFRGDDSDSNILKIFRCLDRTAGEQYHYYQPGIGTYVVSNNLSRTSTTARLKSWYAKAKDSAVGTSFDHHVVGGYRFLMRFYHPGDEIYFFGFSRGAYVARFLAEMLDYIGLLSHGNEEMVSFAWKAFSQWQSRQSEATERDRAKRHEMFRFMKGFRETFSRPVRRIRFLGLFDTVNSVPRFEAAWMQRSKFPYTARTSAKVIRHCVSIDERRAKFRQDLIYQGSKKDRAHAHGHDNALERLGDRLQQRYRARHPGHSHARREARGREPEPQADEEESTYRPRSRSGRSRSQARSQAPRSSTDGNSSFGSKSNVSRFSADGDVDSQNSDEDEQDIDEIWFSGGHGDVGGGWEFPPDSKSASHVPLVYMIREAQKAGLNFDPQKLIEMGVAEELEESLERERTRTDPDVPLPDIRIDLTSPSPPESPVDLDAISPKNEEMQDGRQNGQGPEEKASTRHRFHGMIHKASVARIHDSLEFSSGLGFGPVLSWKVMEYMPFRRMDLQPDGHWKPIRWPLPCGETRDIPHTARVHGSVIHRMNNDPSYRPGNLIVSGGGRGVRVAPTELGAGEWECVQEPGDPIGEVWVKKMRCSPTC